MTTVQCPVSSADGCDFTVHDLCEAATERVTALFRRRENVSRALIVQIIRHVGLTFSQRYCKSRVIATGILHNRVVA